MAKVYVSSTVADLKAEREAVIDWLVAAGYQPVHSYRPNSQTVRESCLQDVQGCDLYVLILGHRYGFQPHDGNPDKLSITHLEYRRAKGKPCIALLKTIIPDERLSDIEDSEDFKRVQAFREEVQSEVRAGEFHDAQGLIHALSTGVLSELQKLQPDRSLVINSTEWPEHVVKRFSTQLNDEFAFHMRAGEDLSPDHACARYVQGVLRLRRNGTSTSPTGQEFPRMEGPLEDFLESPGVQIFVIGTGGSGKTTMLKHAAADGARKAVQDSRAPIFLYLRLPSFDRSDGGFDLLLDRLSLAAQLDRKDFEMRWREASRPLVCLLDGLNEVGQAYQPSCIQALRTLLQHSAPIHRYVITSRPGSEFEAVSSHSTASQRLQLADMLEFRPHQVQQYLEAEGHTDLLSRISGRLESLASNPFLLWAITRTLAGCRTEEPRNRGSLFRELVDRYIFKERELAKPKPRPTDYNYELVKKPILAQLALTMTEQGVTAVTDGPVLRQQIAEPLLALARRGEQDRELPVEAELFMPKDYAAVSFLRETVDNGVLVRDGDSLRFMHESVQEYFASVALETSTVEDLIRWSPVLNLAELNARGPSFETLVTWAGLSTFAKVTALVERLESRHPLLAATLAVEARLSEETLDKLRHQFLSFTASEHEQRRRLGAIGLAVVPSEKPDVVGWLLRMLGDGEFHDIVKQALKALPPKGILSILVNAWNTSSVPRQVYDHSQEAELLRELALLHSGPLAEVLLDAWTAPDSRRDRVAELVALLDATERWETGPRPAIRDTLLILSVEAELMNDFQRSSELDGLRQLAEAKSEQTVESVESYDWTDPLCTLEEREEIELLFMEPEELEHEREKLAAEYADSDDASLEILVRDGKPLQRAVALDVLVERGASAAVAPAVESALTNSFANWRNALETLPREGTQRHLAKRIATLEGKLLERAQLLAGLLAHEPPRDVLKRVFQNSGEDLRIFAARAARRAGMDGVELLIAQLTNEASAPVVEACVRALGASGSPAALNHLLDLLFEPAARQHWRLQFEDELLDPITGMRHLFDGGAALVHDVLADAGAADRTLDRTERHLRSRRPGDAYCAVHEARRWLPTPRAVELLQHAMADDDPQVRYWAQYVLACAGYAEAWRALLQTELETPNLFTQCLSQRPTAAPIESATRDLLIAASQSVLRPALVSPDRKRRARALELTGWLPESWVGAEWRETALATAEHLLQYGATEERVRAVRALHRFADNRDDRMLTILVNDLDGAVTQCAYDMLGNAARPRLEERLQSALAAGDCGAARHIAELVSTRIGGPMAEMYPERLDSFRHSAGTWLRTGNCEQCLAAIVTLAILGPKYGAGEEWIEVSNSVRAAFYRHDLESMWRRFAEQARSLSESDRQFAILVFLAFEQDPEQQASLVARAAELWPDDPAILSVCIVVDIVRGHRDRATKQLLACQERLLERVNHSWLGDRFAEVDRPHEALRHYRIVVEREPANAEAHFLAGWFAFVTGDFKQSIDFTRRSLTLQPTRAMAEFNLGLALLARRDIGPAETAYRRGIALARRQAPADVRQTLNGALGDFALLPQLPGDTTRSVDRIRASLQDEYDRIRAG